MAAIIWWVTGPLLSKYLLKQEMFRMKLKKKNETCAVYSTNFISALRFVK
jgi:hypothetical protein